MFDWIIVGGGVHGIFHANLFLTVLGVSPERLAVIDPHDRPLARWDHRIGNAGAAYLRSPSSHCLEPDFHALRAFARRRFGRRPELFLEPYARPATSLFQSYAADLVGRLPVDRIWRRTTARRIELTRGGPRVVTDSGEFVGRRVLLTVGKHAEPLIPEWASRLQARGASVHHVYESDFHLSEFHPSGPVVVVGGGMSAAQVALSVSQTGARTTLLAPAPISVSMFDSDPCFIGPKCLGDFRRTGNYEERRDMIASARRAGTVPPFVEESLRRATDEGRLSLRVGLVGDTAFRALDDGFELGLHIGHDTIRCRHVLLATGFQDRLPAEELVEDLSDRNGFPRAPDGYPIPGPNLEWGGDVYIAGALAELEVGPPAANIIGAHNSARLMLGLRSWMALETVSG